MKKLMLVIVFANFLSFYSCQNDISTTEITYTEATALYEDLDQLRSVPLSGDIRELTDPGKVYISEDIILIGEEKEGIHVYDNSNPENPTVVSFIQIPQNKEFFVEGDIIYAESAYDMLKIDISDIQSPQLITRVENAFGQGLFNNQGQALVGFEFEEVTKIIDSNDDIFNLIFEQNILYFDFQRQLIPESAVPSSFAGSSSNSIGTVNRIAKTKDHVYVISGQQLSTFSDESNFQHVNTRDIGWQMETIYPADNNLFIGSQNGMQIIDITNPSNPFEAGWFVHATGCDPVLPVGSVAYVTVRSDEEQNCPGNLNALIVVNTANTNRLTQLQEIEMISPFGMTLIGDKLYVGEGENGLKVFDASQRDFLTEINYDNSVQAYDIIAHPTDENIILISSPTGYGQYEVDPQSESYSLISWISH